MNQNLGRGTMLVAYFILAVAAVIALFPLSLMIISSIKKSTEIVANPLALPSTVERTNFVRAWTDAQLGRSLLNSAATTGVAVLPKKQSSNSIALITVLLITSLQPPGAHKNHRASKRC